MMQKTWTDKKGTYTLEYTYEYKGADGEQLGTVGQYNLEGKKRYIPDFGKLGSYPRGLRPVFGQESLLKGRGIFVVQTAFSAACLHAHDKAAISLLGAETSLDKAIASADLEPLRDRTVTIFADKKQGKKFREHLIKALTGVASTLTVVKYTPAIDVADEIIKQGDNAGKWLSELEQVSPDEYKPQITPKNNPDWMDLLEVTQKGAPVKTIANTSIILRNDPLINNLVAFDERWQVAIVINKPPWHKGKFEPYRLEDPFCIDLCEYLQTVHAMRNSIEIVQKAIIRQAIYNRFDPIQDYFSELPTWDEKPRVDELLIKGMGVEDTPYTRKVSSKYLISLVARALKPGCKVDTMLILTGKQGRKKSTILEALVSVKNTEDREHFTDQIENISNKDAKINLVGPWLLEFSELDALSKKDTATVKAFMVIKTDKYRLPYGRLDGLLKRRIVFAGTSNQAQVLRDSTGGRRFWPVEVGDLDVEYVRQNRDQLWAEAQHRYKQGEIWWFEGEEENLAKEVQEQSRMKDSWEDYVEDYLDNTRYLGESVKKNEWMYDCGDRICTTVQELLKYAVNKESSKLNPHENSRINGIMESLGWKQTRKRFFINGVSKQVRVFAASDEYTRDHDRARSAERKLNDYNGDEDDRGLYN